MRCLLLVPMLPLLASDSTLADLAKLLPSRCETIIGIRGDFLRTVPSPAFYLATADSTLRGFSDIVTQARFDPKRDLGELIACGERIVIVRGSFDRQHFGHLDRMWGDRKETEYRGAVVSSIVADEGEEPQLHTALIRDYVIIGPPVEVRAAIDRLLDGANTAGRPLTPEIGRARNRFDAWVFTTKTGGMSHEIDPRLGFGQSALEPFQLKGLTAGITLGDSAAVEIEVKAANAPDAQSVASVMRLALAATRVEVPAPFQAVIDQLSISAINDSVHVAYASPLADFEQMLLLFKRH